MNILEAAREYLDNVDNGAEYFYQETYPTWHYKFDRQSQSCLHWRPFDGDWICQSNSNRSFYPGVLLATDWQVHYAEPKLKACAHCADEEAWPRCDLNNHHWILCTNCKIRTKPYPTKIEAIAAWNRRDGDERIEKSTMCKYCGKTDVLRELLE